MHRRSSSLRTGALSRAFFFSFVAIAAASPSASVGCSAEPSGTESEGRGGDSSVGPAVASSPLRARFPEASRFVLDASRALIARADRSFGLAERAEVLPIAHRGFRASLPERAARGFGFELHDGFAVRVREIGLEEKGHVEGRAVAYPRAGGTSYWAADERGYEEWLALDPGLAVADRPAAVWAIEGGVLVETAAGAVEIVDETDRPRIRVAAPVGHALSGRAIQPRLEVHGNTIELWADAGGEAALIDPVWTNTMAMSTARYGHAATVLQDGRVLVTGGHTSSTRLNTCEIWDPATGAWTPANSMSFARADHTATLLPNGKVLVVGGNPNGTATELYTPSTGTWSANFGWYETRSYHTATALSDGRVLIAGGNSPNPSFMTDARVYDPWADAVTIFSNMVVGTNHHTATLLGDGRVLVAGGDNSLQLPKAQVFDPTTGAWTATGDMLAVRYDAAAQLLPSGKVLVAGGNTTTGAGQLATSETWDPATNVWSSAGDMGIVHTSHRAFFISATRVMMVGGQSSTGTTSQTDIYDASTGLWAKGSSMNDARALYPLVALANNATMAIGGYANGVPISATEIYTGATLGNGTACTTSEECLSGFCVDGYCCDTACNAGACDACSVALGASADGTCTLLTGAPCNDSDKCTQADTCQNGVCVGNPVVCPPSDQCHVGGTCDPTTGLCSNPVKADGSACNDGKACTTGDTCQMGICQGGAPVVCAPLDQCHVAGTCDPTTGMCSNPALPDGTVCDDGNGCTQSDSCQSGVCTGQNPVTCAAIDQCHVAGTCNPQTGQCSTPPVPDGSVCDDGDACTKVDRCQSGVCTGQSPVTCVAQDGCHEAGTCDSQTGQCSTPAKADGSSCPGGTCEGGVCTSGSSSSSSSSSGGTSSSSSSSSSGAGATSSSSSSSGGEGGSGTGGSGPTGEASGCGCGTTGAPAGGAMWMALGIVLAARRKRYPRFGLPASSGSSDGRRRQSGE